MKKPQLLFIIVALLFFSACSIGRNNLLSTEDSRKSDFHLEAQKLVRPYRVQSYDEIAPLLAKDKSGEILFSLKKKYKKNKIKDIDIEQIDFENEANLAYQILSVSSFSAPTYLVSTHFDQVTWEFFPYSGGWRIIKVDTGSSETNSEELLLDSE